LQGKKNERYLKKSGMKKATLFLFMIMVTGCIPEKSEEHMVKELMETDLAFSDLSLEMGMNRAFIHYCAQEGVLLRNNAMPVKGIASVEGHLAKMDDSGFSLTWKPLHARVAKSGELGYTYGTYAMENKETGGQSAGTYVSVWVKEHNTWKWVLDSGNEGLGE
jgi:ketosteroid isomerase-like protein